MKNKKKKVLIIGISCLLLIGSLLFYVVNNNNKSLINISKLSKEFMDEYFNGVARLNANKNEKNILIVVSKEDITIEKSYGATDVVKAPNNTYMLQYEDNNHMQEAMQKLQKNKDNVSVEENIEYTLYNDDDNNMSGYNSWGIESMGLNHAIDIADGKELETVTVAIIDSGCDMDLFNKYYNGRIIETHNIYDNNDTMYDNHGHGTHIAGTIAEGTPNNVKILPVKATDTGGFWKFDIIASINYITYNTDVDVINMSYGNYEKSESEQLAIEAAKEKNIISVAAAGNDNTSLKHYPSGFDNTISIASVDSNLIKSDFSNYGSSITFTAAGTNIKSLMNESSALSISKQETDDEDHGTISGTSMAAPHATSAVAILKSFNKDLSFDDVINILKDNAIDLGAPGYDEYYGYGLINLSELEVCDDSDNETCNDGFKKFIPVSIEVSKPQLTNYNYGSITNILSTEISIISEDNRRKIKKLDELDNLDISGYNPYTTEEQTVTVKYDNFETTFKVSNPENYELGWNYITKDDSVSIYGYKDSTQTIKKLYFPEIINEKPVIGIENSDEDFIGVFNNSNNKLLVEEIILPSSVEYVGNFAFKDFNNLKTVVSLAETLIVGKGSFYNLSQLYELDANIALLDNSTYAFYGTEMLDKVVLSENTSTIIPAYSFYNSGLQNGINIPETITIIENSAFMSSGIKYITLPDSLIEIQENAFYNTSLKEIYIPFSVTKIAVSAFSGNPFLSLIEVSSDNSIYDSRDDSNAIIETDTNKIIVGTNSTKIPNTVEIIGEYAFLHSNIKKIEIPESVKSINLQAFSYCSNLSSVILPQGNIIIDPSAFYSSGTDTVAGTILYVYRNSYSESFAREQKYSYSYIENLDTKNEIIGIGHRIGKTNYKAFEKINTNDVELSVIYMNSTTKEITTEEIDPQTYEFIYQSSDESLVARDRYYTILFDTNTGYYNLKFRVEDIVVEKETPVYTIPETRVGRLGQKLNNVALPNGFNWIDGNKIMDQLGLHTYKAKYVPEDSFNYEIVDNIDIEVNVTEDALGTIQNNTMDFEGLYDGEEHSIIINVDALDYTIKYSIGNTNYDLDELPMFKEVGEYIVNYKISCQNYNDLYGSNKVKIYGLKFESSVVEKNQNLIIYNNSLENLKGKISYYAQINFGITIEHFNKDRNKIETNEISTSDILKLSNPFFEKEYKLVYLGDTNGDGKINYLDYVSVYNHIQKVKYPTSNKNLLENEYLLAADISSDDKINYLDYVRIYNKIKELKGGTN